jgi:hypothetical protein
VDEALPTTMALAEQYSASGEFTLTGGVSAYFAIARAINFVNISTDEQDTYLTQYQVAEL